MIKIYTGYKILIQLYINQVNYIIDASITYLQMYRLSLWKYDLNYLSTIILINLSK